MNSPLFLRSFAWSCAVHHLVNLFSFGLIGDDQSVSGLLFLSVHKVEILQVKMYQGTSGNKKVSYCCRVYCRSRVTPIRPLPAEVICFLTDVPNSSIFRIFFRAAFCFFDRIFLLVHLQLEYGLRTDLWCSGFWPLVFCWPLTSVIWHLIYLFPIPSIPKFNDFVLKF